MVKDSDGRFLRNVGMHQTATRSKITEEKNHLYSHPDNPNFEYFWPSEIPLQPSNDAMYRKRSGKTAITIQRRVFIIQEFERKQVSWWSRVLRCVRHKRAVRIVRSHGSYNIPRFIRGFFCFPLGALVLRPSPVPCGAVPIKAVKISLLVQAFISNVHRYQRSADTPSWTSPSKHFNFMGCVQKQKRRHVNRAVFFH